MISKRGMVRSLSVALTGAGLLALPGLASASDVTLNGNALVLTDPAGAARNSQIELGGGGNFLQVDEGAPMTTPTGGGCNLVMGGTAVRCPAAGVTRILVDAGVGADIVQVRLSIPATVSSVIRGKKGDDILEGGNGPDKIDGGVGGDQLIGNGNKDTVTYAGVSQPLSAQIGGGFVSGSALDGPVGSRDQVGPDIENLIGGTKHNKLTGSNAGNRLVGGPKQDKLVGKGGNDIVLGKAGRDYVIGKGGNDRLKGGPDHDKIAGGGGLDKLFALDGGFDGPINCGPGNNALESATYDVGIDPLPVNC